MKFVPLALTIALLPSTASAQPKATASRRRNRKSSSKSSKAKAESVALYTMTNAESRNDILMYSRDPDSGKLEYRASYSTGGVGGGIGGAEPGSLFGQGDPLGSTGSLTVAGSCLLAANAGSDTVTSFSIDDRGGLFRAGEYSTNGELPVSIASKQYSKYYRVVYVLNAGGEGSLTGYSLSLKTCEMDPIEDSTVSLGQQDTNDPPAFFGSPAQVGFVPDTNVLVVQIKGMDGVAGPGTISLYEMDAKGILGQPSVTTSNGAVSFSFAFDDDGNLLANEAGGNAVTSYEVDADEGSLEIIDASVSVESEAPCWIQQHDGCVVTTNGGGSLSTLSVDDGELTLLEASAAEFANPLDLEFSTDGAYLYVLGGGEPAIHVYEVKDCKLEEIQVMEDVPSVDTTVFGVVGLALYDNSYYGADSSFEIA